MSSEQKAAYREQLGFGWWTFWGWASLIVGTLFCLGQLRDLGGFAVLLVILNIALSVLMLKYSKTAFVIATVLSINPILWVINGVYVRNRWHDPRVLENKANGGPVDRAQEPTTAGTVTRVEEPRTAPLVPSSEPVIEPESASNISVPSDEELWSRAMAEAESGGRRQQGLWAKCFAEARGVESAAKAAYMTARVAEMKAEIRAELEATEARRRAEALERQLAHLSEEQKAYERLPKGTCPDCDAVIPLSSVECPKCKANFGPGSAWKVKPLT